MAIRPLFVVALKMAEPGANILMFKKDDVSSTLEEFKKSN